MVNMTATSMAVKPGDEGWITPSTTHGVQGAGAGAGFRG